MTKIHIVHLYPNEMNTYGDRGNLLTLQRRAEWHGLKPVIHYYHAGQSLPEAIDIILGGGGQDSSQDEIETDVLRIGDQLHSLVEQDVPMLMVCGTYQLFGNRFITNEGKAINGIGVFDVETTGGSKRLVGNVAVETKDFGMLYGFENHSGRTMLLHNQIELGRLVRGSGNNGTDKKEGARTRNAIGTYMHGPLLPNNPQLSDGLITLAMQRRGIDFRLKELDDSLALKARETAAHRKY